MTNNTKRFDVVSVHIESLNVRVLTRDKTEPNAEALVQNAVLRRGVDTHFFAVTTAGKYSDGDKWEGSE